MKEGWTYKKLGEVCEIFNGNSINADYKKKHFLGATSGYPFIATKDVSTLGEINYENGVKIPNYKDFKVAPPNSVFICAEGGSAGKKFAYVEKNVCFGNKLFCINPKQNTLRGKLIYYYVQSAPFKKQFNSLLSGLIGGVSAKKFQSITLHFPSNLSEQQRIVAQLDGAFAEIDMIKAEAEKQLSDAKALFQKVLSQAMTPKEGWEKKTLKEISVISGDYGLSVPSKPFNGVRYLRITDITDDGELNEDYVSANIEGEVKKEPLAEGDILFARTGATVGKTLVYKKNFGECLYAGYLIRYRLNQEIIIPKFMHYITHSQKYYDWVLLNQEAAAQPNINAKKYNLLEVVCPPLSEQQRIVEELDELSENVKEIEALNNKLTAECDAMKQALLRQVFE